MKKQVKTIQEQYICLIKAIINKIISNIDLVNIDEIEKDVNAVHTKEWLSPFYDSSNHTEATKYLKDEIRNCLKVTLDDIIDLLNANLIDTLNINEVYPVSNHGQIIGISTAVFFDENNDIHIFTPEYFVPKPMFNHEIAHEKFNAKIINFDK